MKPIAWLLASFLVAAFQAYAQSPREQLNQFVTQLRSNPGDSALRERIIQLAQEIKPAPALPEEAERRMVRGSAAFRSAKSESDFKDAVSEFEQASLAAPWASDIYYNLGVAQDKAGDFASAMRSLKLALLAAPDSRESKNLLYELEYRAERGEKEKANARADAERKKERARVLDVLRGTYHGRNCQVGGDHFGGCNESQRMGRNWHRMEGPNGPIQFSFTIRDDGTVQAPGYMSWAECKDHDKSPVIGTPEGQGISAIVWVYRPVNGSARRIWAEAASDGSWIRFSCDRPLENANPGARYHYITYSRP